jgi:ATP-dependent DNA ligase
LPDSSGANCWPASSKNAPAIIRLSDELRGIKDELLRVGQQFGLEGPVAKKPNPVYESGRRSGAWVKFKITMAQQFVIGGYSCLKGAGAISAFCWSATIVLPASDRELTLRQRISFVNS